VWAVCGEGIAVAPLAAAVASLAEVALVAAFAAALSCAIAPSDHEV
jgi:hypothetical protein